LLPVDRPVPRASLGCLSPGAIGENLGLERRVEEVSAMTSSNAERPAGEQHVPVEEQARQQGVRPLTSADELVVPGMFESDEELDEFLADLYASRRAGMA
jgi:hypothetical protein